MALIVLSSSVKQAFGFWVNAGIRLLQKPKRLISNTYSPKN